MKKVLVTGAGGTIGVYVAKYLLAEGKYEVTLLDLKNKTTLNRLKRFKKRANIVYGDITNRVLMEALVKDHDYIIHLASSRIPLANMKEGLAKVIDYEGSENIIRAITYYNPKCHLFYASTTSLYKGILNPSVKSKISIGEFDYYNKAKYDVEKLIKDKLKNYTIYRIPLVLCNPVSENFIYTIKRKSTISFITKEDCAYAFVKGINYREKLNKKVFNLADKETIIFKDLLNNILKINGLSFKYVFSRAFLEKTYVSPVCTDQFELEDIIHYQNDSLREYYGRLKRQSKKRNIQKIFAKPWRTPDK